MFLSNDIIKKKTRTAKILAVMLCCLLTTSVKYAETHSNQSDSGIINIKTSDIEYVIGLIILISMCMLHFSISEYKNQKQAMELTVRFILDYFIDEHPETRQYINALRNPQTLKMVTNVICNELGEYEQNKIIEIANKFEETDLTKQTNLEFHNVQHDIIDIVHQYSINHPEYTYIIKNTLAEAHKTYLLNMSAKTR